MSSSAYSRRIQTSRREIAIAITLTVAALILTLAALWSGAQRPAENVSHAPVETKS